MDIFQHSFFFEILFPLASAYIISMFASLGGLSGAFILLPFQMSVLGFDSPAVSATNHLYNIIAIPGGVYRFVKEKRMLWPLAWIVVIATLPGVILGVHIRILYLPDPEDFKLFVGIVLFYLAIRMLLTLDKEKKVNNGVLGKCKVLSFGLKSIVYEFQDEKYTAPVLKIMILSLLVGIVGGIYGIGGGAIIAPIYIAVFGLPVYTIAGATLMGTFFTSLVGVVYYFILSFYYPEISIAPDWQLGLIIGVGGFFGIYTGARLQKRFSSKFIKFVILLALAFISLKYVIGYFI